MKQRLMFFTLGLCLTGALLMPAAPPASAQLFGESDKDKAARLQREDDQEAAISQLSGRTQQLEDKVRSLTDSLSRATGANEELRHELQTTNQKMDRQEKDFAYRLCVISAQQLGADADSGLNCAAVGAPANAGATNFSSAGGIAPGAPLPPINGGNNDGIQPGGFSNAPQANQPTQLGRPPGTLGTLPAGSAPAARPQGAMNTNSGAGASQFDSSMNLLARAQYNEAKAGVRAYADANPDDADLSSQAIYWVGDISYVQRDYPGAARAFAEQIKKYPQSTRGPDSMLKLGQSLLAMGQNKEGCTTLGALKSKYPKASASTLAAATTARKTACR